MNDRSGQISRRDALRMALGAGLALRPRGLRAHEAARLDLYTQVTTLVLRGLVAGTS